MEFKREIIIDEPIEKVWDVLGNQYGAAYKWAGGINHSNEYGNPKLAGAHCNNRACDTTTGKIKEVINKFDTKNYILEYEVIEGFPFFVQSGSNNWKLTKQGERTKVDMHLIIKTKGLFGTIMSPMMKIQMNKITAGVLDDLKHYVETGNPSPTKAKELAKLAKKAA